MKFKQYFAGITIFLASCGIHPVPAMAQQVEGEAPSTISTICKRYSDFVIVASEFKQQGTPIYDIVNLIDKQFKDNPAEANILREIAFEVYRRIPALQDPERVVPFVQTMVDTVYMACYAQLSNATTKE